jgi:hypothetical protein
MTAEGTVGAPTCLLLDGGFSTKLRLSAGKRGQQQGASIICTENVLLWHPFLAKGDTSETFEMWNWGLFNMAISILGS